MCLHKAAPGAKCINNTNQHTLIEASDQRWKRSEREINPEIKKTLYNQFKMFRSAKVTIDVC